MQSHFQKIQASFIFCTQFLACSIFLCKQKVRFFAVTVAYIFKPDYNYYKPLFSLTNQTLTCSCSVLRCLYFTFKINNLRVVIFENLLLHDQSTMHSYDYIYKYDIPIIVLQNIDKRYKLCYNIRINAGESLAHCFAHVIQLYNTYCS